MANVTVIQPTKARTEGSVALKPERRKVAGYARVSTDRDEQFTSYEAQVEYYTRFIKAHDDWDLVNIYTDEGITGTSTKRRTGFQNMVKDALDGKIDLIVTKSVSRFARNTVDSLTTIRTLKEHGVEVFFEKENIWTFDGKGELLITIMSSLAQEESRSISENVTWGMREAMRQGKASVPYKVFLGYEKGPDGKMVVNPEQAMLVRRIYGMFLQGKSPYHITQVLESEGIPFSEGKTKWHASTIKSILQNEKYKGDALRQKTYSKDYLTKERVKNDGELQQYYISDHHEAIISPELFDRVQLEIQRRGTAEEVRGGNKLFSKRIRCADCGSWYGPVTWAPYTPYEKIVWRCNKKYAKGKEHCEPPAVTEDEMKAAFISALNHYLSHKDQILASLQKTVNEVYSDKGIRAEADELVKEIRVVEILLKTANPKEVDGLNERLDIAESRLEELQQELENLRLRKVEMKEYMSRLAGQKKLVTEFDEDLWYSLVDFMTVVDHSEIWVTFKDGTKIRA